MDEELNNEFRKQLNDHMLGYVKIHKGTRLNLDVVSSQLIEMATYLVSLQAKGEDIDAIVPNQLANLAGECLLWWEHIKQPDPSPSESKPPLTLVVKND